MATAELPPQTATKPAAAPVKKNPNALLIAFRKYHTWLGVGMTLFIATTAITGIYLNHKQTFNSVLPLGPVKKDEKEIKADDKPKTEKSQGEEKPRAEKSDESRKKESDKPRGEKPKKPKPETIDAGMAGPLTTATDLTTLPVSFADALAAVRAKVGDQPVEKIELKNERGKLVYKIETAGGMVVVDPTASAPDNRTVVAVTEEKPTDWGKIIKDVHTGKIGGLVGKLTADFTAVVLTLLCATGVYLWVIPLLRKRRSARERAAAEAARTTATG